ncbi:MAG: YqgE/AlgH family protein [Alphaproteobacteria bacterium]|nr:YqgE/AlgH family protein [Alphaproteobacteria bacterium]
MARCAFRLLVAGLFLLLLGFPATANKGTTFPEGPAPEGRDLTGWLLVAAPEMQGSIFTGTVIYVARHTAESAFGLIVNRPIGAGPVGTLLEGFGLDSEGVEGEVRVHFGGPVEPGAGFVLHSTDRLYDGDMDVSAQVAIDVGLDALRDIAAGRGPKRSLFALGYAGWGPGQLESELERGTWVTVPYDEHIVFDDAAETKWERALARSAVDL